jgi:hypothetical protein
MENPLYSKNVFINCPFDDAYKPLFNAIIFTVQYCGFISRCARENDDSGEIRLEKIISIIKECKFSIHDISRTEIDKNTNLPRFNMPLELGIDIGIKKSGIKEYKNKQTLIIDKEQFRYRNFISDISGQDIKSHNNEEEIVIKCTREFLGNHNINIAHGSVISKKYLEFKTQLPDLCATSQWTINELSFNEFIFLANTWIRLNTN